MVPFAFYRDVYRGDRLEEARWDRLAAQAQAVLERFKVCFTVTAPHADSESLAICAMAETMDGFDSADGPLEAVSLGSLSVRYGQGRDLSLSGRSRELYRRAGLYLNIYRGVAGC